MLCRFLHLNKSICAEEERLKTAPQSEPESGESPEGGSFRESPPSSEPNAASSRLRRVGPLQPAMSGCG